MPIFTLNYHGGQNETLVKTIADYVILRRAFCGSGRRAGHRIYLINTDTYQLLGQIKTKVANPMIFRP
jgi:hypothetical protein